MDIYIYSSCGSCKKALKWLEENKIEVNIIDIIQCPPSKKLLKKAANNLGDRKYLFNTSGKSYRLIGAQKIKLMSDQEAFASLSEDAKLIKRPFLRINESEFLVGFQESIWEKTFRI